MGLLRSVTPQTKTCLWGPRSGDHFVVFIPVWANKLQSSSRCSEVAFVHQ
jgi:hypothetical protein